MTHVMNHNNKPQERNLPEKQPEKATGIPIRDTLKLLRFSKREATTSVSKPASIQAAGITSAAVDVTQLTEEQRAERNRQILQAIMHVEDATQLGAAPVQRTALFQWLAASRYSIQQIHAAAESVAVMETFSRPFALEFWTKAFAQPLIHPKRIRELCRQAYEKGRRKGQEAGSSVPASSPVPEGLTKRLLEAEKEIMELREERDELKTRNSYLEREEKTLKRKIEQAREARFYRIGDRLIVEHFRENGEVYYHCHRTPCQKTTRQHLAPSRRAARCLP